jgi:hypothetical protein
MHSPPTPRTLACTHAGIAALTALLLGGCAGTAWQTPVSAETHRDIKSFVDFNISSITELERRLESSDTKEEFIKTLDFAASTASSVSARRKLLVTRYPALAGRSTPPSPVKEELERLGKFLVSKLYVIQSLHAGAVRYGSHPSVMQALQKYATAVSRMN